MCNVLTAEYEEEEEGEHHLTVAITVTSPERTGLGAIKEDEETPDDNISEIPELEEKRPPTQPDHNDEVFETVNNNKGLNENELNVLSMLHVLRCHIDALDFVNKSKILIKKFLKMLFKKCITVFLFSLNAVWLKKKKKNITCICSNV